MIKKELLNPDLLVAEYAVRGPIVQRAQELEEKGRKIVYCNIGNPQALRQPPMTYFRQMLSLLEYPALVGTKGSADLYPRDVIERASKILAGYPLGTGAYSQSAGIPFIRQAVADFIAKRDGIPAVKENVILTDGASKGAQAVLMAMLTERHDGFMIPIPQYPLYSATIALYGGSQIGYFLDEDNGWQLSERILEESISSARSRGVNPVGIVVINPGNPTGAVLSQECIRMVIKFARKHNLVIIADEVYQENVYDTAARFHSFARVLHDLGDKETTLFSLHSVSKGFLGECGHRGGYLEMRNVPTDVRAEFIKLQSISLCANLPGQFVTYMMVAPPQPGEESYQLYRDEKESILSSLKRKAEILGEGIRRIGGLSVDTPQGAMYAFVQLRLPPPKRSDIEHLSREECIAYESKRDEDYCMALLEETGICVVPGSGFGQRPGTLHFRTTFLPPQDEIEQLIRKLQTFHQHYTRELETV